MSDPTRTFLSRQPVTGSVLKGVVPTFTATGPDLSDHKAKLVHFTRSTRADLTGVVPDPVYLRDLHEAEMAAARKQMQQGLPTLRRTDGIEKRKVLAKELWDWVQEAMTATHGNWTPPKSLVGKIVSDSWRAGDPITYEDCVRMAQAQLERTRHQSNPTRHLVHKGA